MTPIAALSWILLHRGTVSVEIHCFHGEASSARRCGLCSRARCSGAVEMGFASSFPLLIIAPVSSVKSVRGRIPLYSSPFRLQEHKVAGAEFSPHKDLHVIFTAFVKNDPRRETKGGLFYPASRKQRIATRDCFFKASLLPYVVFLITFVHLFCACAHGHRWKCEPVRMHRESSYLTASLLQPYGSRGVSRSLYVTQADFHFLGSNDPSASAS